MIKNKIKSLIDDYLNITRLNDLKKNYTNYLKNKDIDNIENNFINILAKKQKKIHLESLKEFIKQFEIYMKELIKFKGENNEAIDNINNQFEEIKEYSNKQFLSSLVLIGEYSSGKSSFINSLIGSNINLLQVKSGECSQVAIIVRYIEKKEKITLYSATLEYEKFGYFFKEDKKIAEGEMDVKNKIAMLNENKNFGYYILYTYIKAFDDLHFELELKKKIELIDFPGLSSSQSNDKIEKEIDLMLEKESAFIFLKHGKEFNIEQSERTIHLIYEIISKKNYYNINNCLFVFTFPNGKENFSLEEYKKSLIEIFDKQTIDHCMIKRKQEKNFITENKLIITKFDSPLYEDYLEFDKISDNFSLFTENLINKCKNEKKTFFKCVDSTLISGSYSGYSENYSTLEIKDKKEKEKYEKILNNILKNNSIYMTKNNISAYIEYYLKIKENKNLYLPFKNSYYEETIQQLKTIISNIEIRLNEKLNYQINDFSVKIFELFDRIENFIIQRNVTITTEEVEEIKNKINKTIKDLNYHYSFEKKEIIKLFNVTKEKINLIKIDNITYNNTKEELLKSEEKIKNKYIKKIDKLDTNLDTHFRYFEIFSKKVLDDLNNDQKFKTYFNKKSSEYNQKIDMIEEYKNQIKENLQIEDYKEYNYFDNEEYKNSSYFGQKLKYFKGRYINYIHDYIKDQKNRAETVISEINLNFQKMEKKTLEHIQNKYNEINSKLVSYQEFINSKWENIIKNKRKYFDLAEQIIKYLEKKIVN